MKTKLLIVTLVTLGIVLAFATVIAGHNFLVLNPKGFIANKQLGLILLVLPIMFAVAIPTFIMTFFIAWKYRAGNTKATYAPDWDHSPKLQTLWWGILCTVIAVLCVITWNAAHTLDPHVPINSSVKLLKIQVVGLQWKWLFIYPEQGIASVNYVAFPEKTPIIFELTGDAPMNSFWIPQLGGQMYAMAGMVTRLPLMADNIGEFRGSSAEISGRGFAGMRFIAKSVSRSDFDAWISSVKQSHQPLTLDAYKQLVKPSEDTPPTFYSSTEDGLYTTIIMQFMPPHVMESGEEMNGMPGMEH